MTTEFLYNFIKQHTLAVISTITKDNRPESALIGIAVTPGLEIVFDTLKSTRKYRNICDNNKVALVIGWNNETTVQYEGIATELSGADAQKYKEVYFSVFSDGRDRAGTWPGIVHFKIAPTWIRYSSFNEDRTIEEIRF